MNIAVLGVGYVGIITAICAAEKGHVVKCFDPDENKISQYQQGIAPFYEKGVDEWLEQSSSTIDFGTDIKATTEDAEIVFICVGTPQDHNGEANLSYIRDAVTSIADVAHKDAVVVIKSTVPPGTAKTMKELALGHNKRASSMHFAMVPEFLAQGTALDDGRNPSRIVLGVEDDFSRKALEKLYEDARCPILVVDTASAELTKYAANSLLATKITFVNEMSRICEAVGADIEQVTTGMGYDPRIGHEFLRAGVGYGGSCFPKDTRALSHVAKHHGLKTQILNACIESNEDQIVGLLNKARDMVGSFNGLTVAVLGLAFKSGTGDMRCAASIPYIAALCEEGAHVHGYDPISVYDSAPEGFTQFDSAIDALQDADLCFILTDDPAVTSLGLGSIGDAMKRRNIFDGRNCFDLSQVEASGCFYASIGRRMVAEFK